MPARMEDGSGRALAVMLAASIAAHVALLALTRSLGPKVAPPHAPAALVDPVDVWAGTTSLPGELVEVGLAEAARPAPPSAPPAPAEPPAKPAEPPVAPAHGAIEPNSAAIEATSRHLETRNGGPVAGSRPSDVGIGVTKAESRHSGARDGVPEGGSRHFGVRKAVPQDGGRHPASDPDKDRSSSRQNEPQNGAIAPPGGSAAGGEGSFGAEGEKAASRDIGRAFTRALPAACVADAAWGKEPLGDAGRITIRVTLDERGKITGWEPDGGAPPPARLVATVKRTLAMLEAGTFALAKGEVGEGVAVLEIRATVEDAAPSGEEGAASAMRLEQHWQSGRGTAAFTQASGRRVAFVITRGR
jgi:hypothetical protein